MTGEAVAINYSFTYRHVQNDFTDLTNYSLHVPKCSLGTRVWHNSCVYYMLYLGNVLYAYHLTSIFNNTNSYG